MASKIHYSEDPLVQQTTADYLEQDLGWESVYAYSNEDFRPERTVTRQLDGTKLAIGRHEAKRPQ